MTNSDFHRSAESTGLIEAGLRHADGLTAQLAKPDWIPLRSHIEQARNTIVKLSGILKEIDEHGPGRPGQSRHQVVPSDPAYDGAAGGSPARHMSDDATELPAPGAPLHKGNAHQRPGIPRDADAPRKGHRMGPGWPHTFNDAQGAFDALVKAEAALESIRLILVNHLEEPERSAFWKAVTARDAIRAALAETKSRAKEPEANAGSEVATSGLPATGSSRPVDGRSSTATSELMDVTAGETAPHFQCSAASEPAAWLVTWTTKNNGPTASAYVRERDARDAARNVEKYADASNVVVAPAYTDLPQGAGK